MPQPIFHTPINDLSVTLAADHTIGDGELVVSDASRFDPSPTNPVRVCVGDSIFSVVGKASNTLQIDTTLEGTSDGTYLAGTAVEVRFTGGDLDEVHAAIKATNMAAGNVVIDGTATAVMCVGGDGTLETPSGLTYSSNILNVDGQVNTTLIDYGIQGGTIEGPLSQILWKHQPVDPTFARWEMNAMGSFFVGVWDPVLQIGYNPNQNDSDPGRDDQCSLYLGFEANYFEPPTEKLTAESYIQYNPPRDAAVQFQRRPWMFTLDKETGSTRFGIEVGPEQTDFGYFQVTGGPANGGSFQLMSIVTGATAATGMTRIFTPLEVSKNTTFNEDVTVIGAFSCGQSASDDNYIGTNEYDGVYRLNVGTTVRTGMRNLLLGRNLQGSDSSDYITSGTSAVAGYAGIEFRDTGDVRIYSASGATTAGASVTPSSRFTIVASTGRIGVNEGTPGAQHHVTTSSSSTKGTIVKAAASQSVALSEWQSSTSTVYASIGSDGSLNSNVATVLKAAGTNAKVLDIMSTTGQVGGNSADIRFWTPAAGAPTPLNEGYWQNKISSISSTGSFLGALAFYVNYPHGTLDEAMRLHSFEGRMGIRNTNPSGQLHVQSYSTGTATSVFQARGATATINNVALTSNVATITTSAAHGFRIGDLATLSGLATSVLNGSYSIISVPTTTTFTFAKTNADIASVADSGTATITQTANLTEWKGTAGTNVATMNVGGFLDLSGSNAGLGTNTITFNNGVTNWQLYRPGSDPLLYLRDNTNSRMQVTYVGGASSNVATTQISSLVGVNEASPGAQLQVTTAATTRKGFIVKGISGQAASLIEAQDSTGAGLFVVDQNGTTTWTTTSNAYVLTIQNANKNSGIQLKGVSNNWAVIAQGNSDDQFRIRNDTLGVTAFYASKEGLIGFGTSPNSSTQLVVKPLSNNQNSIISRGAVPGSWTINNVALTSNVATITTSSAHIVTVGSSVVISGLTTSALNGTYTVVSVPTTTSFTFAKVNADIASTADSGTATISQIANIQEWQTGVGGLLASVSPNGVMKAAGFASTVVAKNAAYVITLADGTVIGDASGGDFAVTLPLASTAAAGRCFTIKSLSTGTITVTAAGSDTIDGSATYALAAQWKYVTVQSTGTAWIVIGNN